MIFKSQEIGKIIKNWKMLGMLNRLLKTLSKIMECIYEHKLTKRHESICPEWEQCCTACTWSNMPLGMLAGLNEVIWAWWQAHGSLSCTPLRPWHACMHIVKESVWRQWRVWGTRSGNWGFGRGILGFCTLRYLWEEKKMKMIRDAIKKVFFGLDSPHIITHTKCYTWVIR